jgi:hypothetical protein
MLVAYLSYDEVNTALAEPLARRHGITLDVLQPRDAAPNGEYDAVLYDWDCWPCVRRAQAVAEWLSEAPSRPTALHSYNMEDEQAEALRRNGVVVESRLGPALFRRLRQAILAARVAGTTADGRARLPADGAPGAA